MSFYTTAEGVHIFTKIDGPATAPWLVMSNSLAADHTMWDPQLALLTKTYRLLRYDTRGHGASGAAAGPYSFEMLVEDVLALMDHNRIERAAFIGISLGGMTGLGLALTHPERVTRLVCADARADAPSSFVKGWDDRIALVDKNGMAGIVEATLERWFEKQTRAARPDFVKQIGKMIVKTSAVGYKGCVEALKRLDYLKDLQTLRMPTLFVVGEGDQAAPPEAMRRMAESVPGAAFKSIANAAHLSNLDNPSGFNNAIADFLQLTN